MVPSLREIFEEAAEIEQATDRIAYLDQVCAADPALRSEIDELLRAHESASGFLTDSERHVLADSTVDLAETTIGPYRLLKKLGEGGMGEVYQAEQAAPVKREVAIKIVKLGMNSKQVIARFAAERQALALMDHPHIAKVYDAGTTESGRPFFVMELIRGVPITKFCNDAKLDTSERLTLFLKVCEAIQHAHQKGVIHRDIKPSNVFVTDREGLAEPRVIDFGIAKATEVELTEHTLMTHSAQMLGTLQYMSPEQFGAHSQKIDVRSDVYSLGVILFELVAGRLPHDFGSKPLHEIARMVIEDPATRASTTSHTLRGDLDIIIGKALQNDPERRYDSASAFAADINRFLRHEPIAARPTSIFYQGKLFARRHRALVAGSAIAIAALIAGFVAALLANVDARKAREVAENQAHRASLSADAALAANVEALKARELAETQAYRASISAAVLAQRDGDRALSQSHLENIPSDRRGWIWQLLAAQADEPLLTFKGKSIAFSETSANRTVGESGVEEIAIPGGEHQPIQSFTQLDDEYYQLTSGATLILAAVVKLESKEIQCRVLDAATGAILASFTCDRDRVQLGKNHVAYNHGGSIIVQNLKTKEQQVLALNDPVLSINPAGTLLALTNPERGLNLLNISSGTVFPQFNSGRFQALRAAFSADGRKLVAINAEMQVKVWDTRTGSQFYNRNLPRVDRPSVVALSSKGEQLAVTSDQRVILIDLNSRGERILSGLPDLVGQMQFSPDGKQLAATDSQFPNQTSRPNTYSNGIVWSTQDPTVLLGHRDHVHSVAFSPDGKRIVSGGISRKGSPSGEIRVWDAASGAAIACWGQPGRYAEMLAFTPDGSRLVSSGKSEADGKILTQIWDAETGTTISETPHYTLPTLSPDGTAFSRVSSNRFVVTDIESQERRLSEKYKGLTASSYPIFSPDGTSIAAAGQDFTIRICDSESLRIKSRLRGHTAPISSISFSADGKQLVSTSFDDTTRIWDPITGSVIAVLQGAYSDSLCAVFAPDGQHVITGSRDGRIRLWNIGDQKIVAELSGHRSYVHDLALSPDGKTIVSESGDRTLRIWSTEPRSTIRQSLADREALVAELTPLVIRLFRELQEPHAVIAKLRAELEGRRLEVALQIALAESASLQR